MIFNNMNYLSFQGDPRGFKSGLRDRFQPPPSGGSGGELLQSVSNLPDFSSILLNLRGL